MANATASPTFVYSQPIPGDPGFLYSTSGSAWLFRVVPPAPCTDAATPEDRDRSGEPLMGALRELEGMTSTKMPYRRIARNGYREIHLLTSVLPGHFEANPNRPDAEALNAEMGGISVAHHQALLGVRLTSSAKRDTWRQAIADVAATLAEGGTSLDDFEADYGRLDKALGRHGLATPTMDQIRAALAWWNEGGTPSTIMLPDGDHMHVFVSHGSAKTAQRSIEREVDCTQWGPSLSGHRVLTLASVVSTIDGWEIDSSDEASLWISRLHRGGAVAVSVRAFVEPSGITRAEMRRNRRKYESDINEARQNGKMDRAEAEERLLALTETERAYSRGAPPTLTECRVTVAMDGQWADPTTMSNGLGVSLEPLVARQAGAWQEMQLCSEVRENPWRHDWPAQRLSHSGAADVSIVGDGDMGAVLWGFTEHDRQPAFFEPRRATDEDGSGFTLVAGATGSGKALALDTKLLTPTGTITMEQVKVGDTLLSAQGLPTTVSWVSPISVRERMYRLRLDTGQEVECDFDHQWPVIDLREGRMSAHARTQRARAGLELADKLAAMRVPAHAQASPAQVLSIVAAHDEMHQISGEAELRAMLHMVDCTPTDRNESLWPLAEALQGLARRLRERHDGSAAFGYALQRLTVGEMLARDGLWFIPTLTSAYQGDATWEGDVAQQAAALLDGEVACEQIAYAPTHVRGSFMRHVLLGCGDQSGARTFWLTLPNFDSAQLVARIARSLGWKAFEPRAFSGAWRVQISTSDYLLQVASIEQIDPAPAKCLTVDDPTRTYLIDGAIPTSNTMLLLNHARQLHRQGRDVVSFGPKPMANASPVLEAYGGRLVDLSDLLSSDGILDAFGYATTLEMAVNLSASNILSANPWGTDSARGAFEVELLAALRAGAQAGARTSGAALQLARQAGQVRDEVFGPIMDLANTSPQFRAFVGISNQTSALRGMRGWTHIQVGKMGLDLPNEREAARGNLTVSQRVSVTLVRSLITSLTYALQERGGSILQDEAWVSMLAGASELDRSGRLCREFGVDIVLYNQKVTEAFNSGLHGYFKRGLVMSLDDAGEAESALRLFNDSLVTPERIERICAPAYRGTAASRAPNFYSMRHLSDPVTKEVVRGSIGYMIDLEKNCVPIEIVLPPSFLEVATTNAAVLRARRAAQVSAEHG